MMDIISDILDGDVPDYQSDSYDGTTYYQQDPSPLLPTPVPSVDLTLTPLPSHPPSVSYQQATPVVMGGTQSRRTTPRVAQPKGVFGKGKGPQRGQSRTSPSSFVCSATCEHPRHLLHRAGAM